MVNLSKKLMHILTNNSLFYHNLVQINPCHDVLSADWHCLERVAVPLCSFFLPYCLNSDI